MLTAKTIADEQINDLRCEQIALWRNWDVDSQPEPFPAADLDYSFAAICGRESVVGLFTGLRITREEGRARCAAILNARTKGQR